MNDFLQMEIKDQVNFLQESCFAKYASCFGGNIILVLNKQRQIIFRNDRLFDLFPEYSDTDILGKKPGEVFNCTHIGDGLSECGTTAFCKDCGANKAILKTALESRESEEECRITSASGQAYDFRVWTAPLQHNNYDYVAFSLSDISHEKRRSALEHTFFHDVSNILGGIMGITELIKGNEPSLIEMLKASTLELFSEIQSHKNLLQAEKGELVFKRNCIRSSVEFLDSLVQMSAQLSPDMVVFPERLREDFAFFSDRSLLFRVIYNMIKNAVEASARSEAVSLSCKKDSGNAIFSVHNVSVIPISVQSQIFQRSYSTKGQGRGIGTYSMKLIGESYLNGKVWFQSTEKEGTTFYISIPIS